MKSFHRVLLALVVVAAPLAFAGCSSDMSSRDEALAALELTTEATNLQSEMGKLVAKLNGDPSAEEQRALQRRLEELDRRAAQLISSAGAGSTYDVELRPLNHSDAVGVATLVDSDGQVAIDGTFSGMSTEGRHLVTIHALRSGEGPSVCPPAGAAAGSDKLLSASEAEDFYGRPAVNLGSIQAGSRRDSMSSAREAGDSPPLTARTVVLSGGRGSDGYEPDLPVACGVPILAPGSSPTQADVNPTTVEVVAAVNETRTAGLDLATVVRDPTTKSATRARESAAVRMQAASRRLASATDMVIAQLEEEGDVSKEDRQAVNRAVAELEGTGVTVRRAFGKLRTEVANEREAQRLREAQRKAAQEAAREGVAPEPAPAPVPEPAPAPEPEPAPAPEPEPAPAPEPSSPEGPSIVHPG